MSDAASQTHGLNRVAESSWTAIARTVDMGECQERADWSKTPLPVLVEHILDVHHTRLRRQMAQMTELWGEVMAMDAWPDPRIGRLQAVYRAFEAKLVFHLSKEERMVFPTIRRLASAGGADSQSIKELIDLLAGEHGHGKELMATMREMTGRFEAVADASASYRARMECLRGMEAGLGPHEQIEGEMLYRRVLAMGEMSEGDDAGRRAAV
jgi:regulator of cell morphogenesis and NO signaling